jgi:hypothetical protein
MAALASALSFGGVASAQGGFLYGGMHPVNPQFGGGFCYTNAAHDHPYPIDASIAYLYRNTNGYQYFVGNPYHFGYQGQAFPYYNHHPLPEHNSYCYIDGAHQHHFLPPAALAASYVVNNGYYYYNGVYSPFYYSYRPSFYRASHSYYYMPTYRNYYRTYNTTWRRYYTPASVSYIYRRPVVVTRYSTPPVRTHTIVRTSAPVYRYNTARPNTYNYNYNRGRVTTTTTTYRPSGATVTRTRSWRR